MYFLISACIAHELTSESIIRSTSSALISVNSDIRSESDPDQKFLRGYIWDGVNPIGYSPAIESSLFARPFPDAPSLERDKDAAYILNRYHYLFKIKTPINVDKMETLLVNHPNPLFVKSAIKGLRFGFWPSSDLPSSEVIEGPNHIKNDEEQRLLESQCQEEIDKGRFSDEFSTLLLGMKVIPLLMVSKKDSQKMRVCSNMSHGHPSPNDIIDKDDIAVTYDSLKSFIPFLIDMKKEFGEVILFKSDIEGAFRIIPLHKQYQIRQIYRIKKKFRVDHNLNFGSSASPHIWCGVFSLVLWIAEFVFGIKYMNNYMDDVWGVCSAKHFVNFKGHQIPTTQAKLLNLFNILGFPWVWKKQLHGPVLDIIGHVVDSEKMIFYLHPDKKFKLVKMIDNFVLSPSHSLKDWQELLGTASWACTSMPWGRFALQSSYEKIAGKTERYLKVHLNREVQRDLRWLSNFFNVSDGIKVLESSRWSSIDADSVYYTDACMTGIGIWEPASTLGYYFILPPPGRNIFWAELLGVVSAIDLGINNGSKRIFVHSDNKLVVDLFSSHCPNWIVRPLFCYCIMRLLEAKADYRVMHVSAEDNSSADKLSRQKVLLTEETYAPLCRDTGATSISYLKISSSLSSGGLEENLSVSNSHIQLWLDLP